jgi:MoaA/NifB/PqqE/SkfB family radical SAM enzyme
MDLSSYMNNAIKQILKEAMLSSQLNMKELLFLKETVSAQKSAAKRRSQQQLQGIQIPPFLIASIATACNLHCKGCYARENQTCTDAPVTMEMDSKRWKELFQEASELGISFILLAGGEPLKRSDVLDEAAAVRSVIFPVFTNGTLFTSPMIEKFDKHRNLVPIISIEGNEQQTDKRRGQGIFAITQTAMKSLKEKGIFFGASITVTKGNLDMATSTAYISTLREAGCNLVLFVEYVPADGNEAPSLDETERNVLADRQETLRQTFKDMVILSFPGDEKKMGGCLAAGRGFFHINAFGAAEPCPFSPFSDSNVHTATIKDALQSRLFAKIRESRFDEQDHSGGCTLFPRRAEVENLLNH